MLDLISKTKSTPDIRSKFVNRFNEKSITRDENPLSHLCVYFAPFDAKSKQVFIGHHRKSDLWLFNGGHMDTGELPNQTLRREIREEFGEHIEIDPNIQPSLLTITDINNPSKQKCRLHYDIWYFLPLDKNVFAPDQNLLQKEFHQTGWKTFPEAYKLVTDSNNLLAMGEIER